MADLLTLPEYKTLAGIADTSQDTLITALIPAASAMVRTYTGRTFEITDGIATDRQFEYDGSGFMYIDDCSTVVSVTTDFGIAAGDPYVLDPATQWAAQPFAGPVYYYLNLYGGFRSQGSLEMGFERNLDRIGWPNTGRPAIMTVHATWGWPAVPDDIKLAAVWTTEAWIERQGGDELTSESIADYSRSWGQKGGLATPALAVPERARDILAAYERLYV
jgi:hypothetical protein